MFLIYTPQRRHRMPFIHEGIFLQHICHFSSLRFVDGSYSLQQSCLDFGEQVILIVLMIKATLEKKNKKGKKKKKSRLLFKIRAVCVRQL